MFVIRTFLDAPFLFISFCSGQWNTVRLCSAFSNGSRILFTVFIYSYDTPHHDETPSQRGNGFLCRFPNRLSFYTSGRSARVGFLFFLHFYAYYVIVFKTISRDNIYTYVKIIYIVATEYTNNSDSVCCAHAVRYCVYTNPDDDDAPTTPRGETTDPFGFPRPNDFATIEIVDISVRHPRHNTPR